jgi:nucleotide-binding universal stress UspA family protein
MEKAEYKILVPTDFSDQSNYALHQAIHLAQIVDGKIVLLFVLQEKKGILGKLFNSEQEKVFNTMVEEKLIEQAKEFTKDHEIEISTKLLHSTSVQTSIVEYADEIQASIIVMGKGAIYKDGNEIPSIGSNTARVLRNSKIPVITISNAKHCLGCNNILLPLDLSKETRQKVSWAIQFAKLFGSKINVVSGLWDDSEYIVKQINAQMNQVVKFIKQQGIEATGEIITPINGQKGLIPILMQYIEEHSEMDLAIIMTQQEDDFTEFFMGSAASAFIRQAKIPVLSIIPRQLDKVIVGM